MMQKVVLTTLIHLFLFSLKTMSCSSPNLKGSILFSLARFNLWKYTVKEYFILRLLNLIKQAMSSFALVWVLVEFPTHLPPI